MRESDTAALRSIWEWMSGKSLVARMELALRRFSRSAGRHYFYDDMIIDAVIALEALLLDDCPDQGEFRFRFATRLGLLLGCDEQTRIHWFTEAKWAYDIRSLIVHGSKRSNVNQNDALRALELCRRCLRRILWLRSRDLKPEWEKWQFAGGPDWSEFPLNEG